MLRFKKYLMEVAKAKSEVDKEVVANHPVKVTDTPFPDSGETVVKTKKDTSRRADNQPGEDETKYAQNNKRGKVAEYHESEEIDDILDQLDEVSKSRLGAYIKKAAESKASSAFSSGQHKGAGISFSKDATKSKKQEKKRTAGISKATDKLTGQAKVNATESEELSEISKERAMSYHDKAVSDSQPLAAKKKKSEDQFRSRIRSGKPLKDFKPKDKLSGDEERKLRNREKWTAKVRNKHLYNESEELDEVSTSRLMDYRVKSRDKWAGYDYKSGKDGLSTDQKVDLYHKNKATALDKIDKKPLVAKTLGQIRLKAKDAKKSFDRFADDAKAVGSDAIAGAKDAAKNVKRKLTKESEYETEDNKRKVKRIKHEKGEIKIMSGRAKEDKE